VIADRCEGLQHLLGSSLDRIALAPFPLAPARLARLVVSHHPCFPSPGLHRGDSSCTRVVLVPFCVTAPLLFLRLRNSATVRDVSTNGGRLAASPHSLSILFFFFFWAHRIVPIRGHSARRKRVEHALFTIDCEPCFFSSTSHVAIPRVCCVHMGTWDISSPSLFKHPGWCLGMPSNRAVS
jgi:hypothetical protein